MLWDFHLIVLRAKEADSGQHDLETELEHVQTLDETAQCRDVAGDLKVVTGDQLVETLGPRGEDREGGDGTDDPDRSDVACTTTNVQHSVSYAKAPAFISSIGDDEFDVPSFLR